MVEITCDGGGHVMVVMYVHLCILSCSLSHPSSPGHRVKAGEEPGELGNMRRKLLQFIESSKHYQPQEHVTSLPRDGEL